MFAFISFGLFTNGSKVFDDAYEKGIITKVFTTNLVYTDPEIKSKPWYADVNMCKYVAYVIDTLNHDQSISGLLDPVNRINKLLARQAEKCAQQLTINEK